MTGLTSIGGQAATMTSLELVDFINQHRQQQAEQAGQAFPSDEFPELLHKNFLAKVPEVLGERSAEFAADLPDSYGRPRRGYRFPKRESCLMLIGSGITPRFRKATFQSYQADGSVPMAQVLVRCRDFAERFPEHYEAGRSLLLVGNVGTGKTHLGSAIVQHVIREHGAQAVITSAAQIIRVAKGAMARNAQYTERDVIEELVGFDLLVIDEVGAQGGTEYERGLLHEVIDQRYQQVLPTVLISNLPADTAAAQAGELTLQDFIGERALDRLRQGGRAVRFTWGSARSEVDA